VRDFAERGNKTKAKDLDEKRCEFSYELTAMMGELGLFRHVSS